MPRHRYRVVKDTGIDAGGKHSSSRPPFLCVDVVVPKIVAYGSREPLFRMLSERLGCVRTVEEFMKMRKELRMMKKAGLIHSWKFVRVERGTASRTWLERKDVAKKFPKFGKRFVKDSEWYETKRKDNE